ncbi:hypothetical protein GQE99_14325 [Maritimibacter sp. DP07]|uniref:Uncharacterized protein n=1 Tax=Maritimibacter harenae TaxID=2606218 RepID=A0A845M2D5_9RHOB|nr:hypothetical protein [Maritimibacter harenae]MZR14195.1 hypothetical protein [Maritimibacter harenae]
MNELNTEFQFASIRRDGLGARIQVLLNAMALSERFGSDFVFDWPDNPNTGSGDTLGPAEKFFTRAFLERHFRPGLADMLEKAGHDLSLSMTSERVDDFLAGRAAPVEWYTAWFQDLRPALKLKDDIYRELFNRIEFAPPIQAAIERANQVPLAKNTRAFHIRAGDVIEKHFRFGGRFGRKVLAFPLAIDLARSARLAGHDVIIFGQDPEVLGLLCDASGGRLAEQLVPNEMQAGPEAWFFEVALMARCEAITTGSFSSFSEMASWIGTVEKVNGYDQFEASAARELILGGTTARAPVRALQKAHAYWALYDVYGAALSHEDAVRALSNAHAHDPINNLYPLSRINETFRRGDNRQAKHALRRFLEDQKDVPRREQGSLLEVLFALSRPMNVQARETSLGGIFQRARTGDPDASLIGALVVQDANSFEEFCRNAARSRFRFRFRQPLEHRRKVLRALPDGLPPAYFRFGRLRRAFGLLPPAGTPTSAPASPPTPPAERPGSVPE